MTDRLILLLLIAGSLAFGAIFLTELAPVGTDETALAKVATRPDTAPATRRQQNPRPEELLATTLDRPLFSSTRRPPQSATAGAATDSDLADTRLAGIVTEPGRRIAIFAVTGAKPLRLVEGEAVSGWRIESITPREVSLSGPSGTKTLQPKLDPNLAPPPGQPPPSNAGGRFPIPPAPAAVGARPPGLLPGSATTRPSPPLPINAPSTPPRLPRPRQQR